MKTVASSMKWFLAAGVGVAGIALFALSSDEPDGADALPATSGAQPFVPPLPAESMEAKEGARPAARPARPSSSACGLDVGRRFGATYLSVSTLELSDGAGVVGERSTSQTVSGRLAFEVLEASDAVAVVLMSFASEQARASGKSKEELAAPFLARVNERCEIEAYARHLDTSEETARLQQSLLHELWFSVPPPNASAQVSFKNAVGEAFGKVRSEADGVIVRTIDLYGDAWSPDMAGVRVHQAVLRIERGGAPWFSSMDGAQRVSVPATGATGTATLEVLAAPFDPEALATASRDVGDYAWEMLLRKMSRQLTAAPPIAQAERIEAMRDVTFEQALTRFGTLVETKALREEQHLIMAAYLDAHPEHIEEYGKALASGFPNDWKPQGYAALQATQHPEAKRALLSIYREERLHPMERVRSSLALSGRHDVGAPVAEELAGVARSRAPAIDKVSVADHALMHLGILAGLHVDDKEVAGIATTTIEGALSSARTPQELKTACLAVANTGNPAFLPALREWSNHPDPDMREHVAIGMRRMPVEAVREWVTEWLSRERSFRVKRELFEVMQRQYHDAGAKLDDALIAQTVAHLDQRPRALTRQSIYRLLTPVARTHADVRRALRESLVMEIKNESGMAHYVMSILPQRDVDAALASIDSLRDQYASTNPVPDPVDDDSPSEPEEAPPPPDDMLEGTDSMALPSEPGTGVGVAP